MLKKHKIQAHESGLNISCKECNIFFSSQGRLNAHQNKSHRKEDKNEKPITKQDTNKKGNFKCEECHKVFMAKIILIDHVNSFHKGLKTHTCGICKKVFGYRNSLNNHNLVFHQQLLTNN